VAFNVGTITAEIELNGQQFIATLKNADEVLKSFGASAGSAARQSSAFGEILTGALRRVGELTLDGVIRGLKSVVSLFFKAIEASDAFEASVQSLDVALRLRGLGAMTEDLVGLAVELEGTTKFSRGAVVDIERLLAVFGVGRQDIPEFTEAVLNLSHAMGIDTTAAARLLGRSLSGSVGRLSQYIPDAKNLSDATLKMGGAFDLVNDKLGGFAKAAANTSEAIEARFFNSITAALQSLGDTLSPILDVFFVLGRDLATRLSEGFQANASSLQTVAAQVGIAIVDVFTLAAEAVTRVLPGFGAVLRLVGQLNAVWVSFKATVLTSIASVSQFGAAAKVALLGVNEIISRLPGFSDEVRVAAQAALVEAKNELAGAMRAAEDLNISLIDSAKAANDFGAQMDTAADGLDSTRSVADQILDGFKADAADAIAALQDLKAGGNGVNAAIEDVSATTSDWLRHLREVNKVTFDGRDAVAAIKQGLLGTSKAARDTADATREIAVGTNEAADSTDELTEGFTRAAAAARSVGEAFSTTGGGFGEFGADNFGSLNANRQGGSFNLGLNNSSQTQAYLNSVQGRLGGLSNIYGSRDLANLQFKKIAELLQSQIREETQAFTTGIIDELNRQGIFDPAQRNSFIAARFDEARRLGTLPRGATYNASTGSIGSYG